MYVRDILAAKGQQVVTTGPGETVAAICRLLAQHRIGAVLVTDEREQVVGIISERDIVSGLATHGSRVLQLGIAELMTRDVLRCRPEDTIADIMGIMTARRIRHLPVIVEGRLAGIVSIGDVVKHRLDETKLEVESLRDYVLAAR